MFLFLYLLSLLSIQFGSEAERENWIEKAMNAAPAIIKWISILMKNEERLTPAKNDSLKWNETCGSGSKRNELNVMKEVKWAHPLAGQLHYLFSLHSLQAVHSIPTNTFRLPLVFISFLLNQIISGVSGNWFDGRNEWSCLRHSIHSFPKVIAFIVSIHFITFFAFISGMECTERKLV